MRLRIREPRAIAARGPWYIVASVWVSLTLCVVALLEAAAAAFFFCFGHVAPPLLEDLSDSQLAALYSTSDPAHVRAVLREGWGRGFNFAYAPFVEMRMAPYTGVHVNVSPEGFRMNSATDAPQLTNGGDAIFLLGGSTSLGVGVSDSETIAAELERILRRTGPSIRVFNLAVSSYYSTQERIQLEQLLRQGQRPAGVVMIDGLNDFYACEYPDRSEASSLLERAVVRSDAESLLRAVAAASHTVRLWRVIRGEASPFTNRWGKHCAGDDLALNQVIQRITTNWDIVRALGRTFSFKTQFVVQPVPTFHYDNLRRPVPELARNLAYHTNSGPGYERMLAQRSSGPLAAPDILWLHDLSIEENQYVDSVHYSPAFNRAIAKRIAESVVGWGISR